MNILIGILTVLEVITALLLIGLVLIQQTKSGGGLGAMGGGVTESVLGAGAGNFFTRATVIVASVFMGITLLLVILTAHRQQAKSVIERELAPIGAKAEAQPVLPAGTASATVNPVEASATTVETVKPAAEPAAVPAAEKPAVEAPAAAPVVAPVPAPVVAPAEAPAVVPAPVEAPAPAAAPAAAPAPAN